VIREPREEDVSDLGKNYDRILPSASDRLEQCSRVFTLSPHCQSRSIKSSSRLTFLPSGSSTTMTSVPGWNV
jgi:hypothetical protein